MRLDSLITWRRHQAAAADPALPGSQRRPLRGLRPDTNGVPFVAAEGQGLRPCAACKDAEGATGVGGPINRR
jgi:hypothetical protein